MKGDLSRETFDRTLHHSAVRLQQGRVVTDADWNEQAEITRHRDQRIALDAFGAGAAPLAGAGFGLSAATYALAVLALDADSAWVLAEDGALLVSHDGGASWLLADLQTAQHLRAARHRAGTGWVVGDRGLLRKTSDHGASWLAQQSGTTATLRGVAVFDADHAWAVGDGGIVLRTSDGGAAWTPAQAEAAALHGVHFIDTMRGIAVGRGGVIVGSSDGGASWTRLPSGSGAHLRAVAGFGGNLVWAVGKGGVILRSSDLGASWQAADNPSTADLHGIAFRDASTGWAVGAGGTLLRSSDGGATWLADDVGLTSTLRGISLVGNEAPWVVGDAGTALRIDAFSPVAAALALPAVNLNIEPGRCYVGGVLCELEQRASYAQQPDGGAGQRLVPGHHLLYLNAWQRHITAIEAPAIREVALGGPDTATRTQTVAQVRALALPDASPPLWNCDSELTAWDALLQRVPPRLAARAEPQLASANLCEIAATAGYRRLENQLYRVEIHNGGAAPPLFKWSRENGSVAYAVLGVSVDNLQQRTTVRLAARGRDANLDLAVGDRVELVDDDAELTRRAGEFFEYLHDGNDELELVLAGVPQHGTGLDPLRHPLLRRWDQRPAAGHLLPVVEGVWTALEEGVEVRFDNNGDADYRPGDHWLIPARTISADVEWPRDADGDPLPRVPLGIVDGYVRLGIVDVADDGSVTVASDCRDIFPPLTALETLLYVSGDGQDAAPGALLPQALRLRVARGSVPSAGRGVRFSVESGAGAVGSVGSANPSAVVLEMATDANGHAACHWLLGSAAATPGRHQRVRASLLDADGNALPGQELLFCASASLSLHYAGGDGQQAAPGAALAQPLRLRISHGADGVAGVALQARVDQGGGVLVGANPLLTDAQGQASIGWQIGGAGPQRVTIELRDPAGQVLQAQTFSAAAVPPVTAGRAGCDVTIGDGGDFEELTEDVLRRVLERGRGSACICMLPGTHRLQELAVDARDEERISLHGCGRASRVEWAGALRLRGFAAVELRDLVLINRRQDGLVLERNVDVRLSNLMLDRLRDGAAREPLLRVSGAERLVMHHCEVTCTMPGTAAVFEALAGDCRISDSRFAGIVSFYGDSAGVPDPEVLIRLRRRVGNGPQLESNRGQLSFSNNSVSMLAIDAPLARGLVQGSAANVFASAVLHGNSFAEADNLFVAGLLSVSDNSFLSRRDDGDRSWGVMVSNRATAAGNLAADTTEGMQLHFVTPAADLFSRAANQLLVNPLVPL